MRGKYTKGGHIVDLEGPLHLDLFQQPRLLINGVGISLKFWPSPNAFRLMSDTIATADEKVQIVVKVSQDPYIAFPHTYHLQ